MTGKILGDRYYVDGQEVAKEEFWQRFPSRLGEGGASHGAGLIGWKPIHSDALGYHPKQIAEATEHLKKLGVPTEIDKKGRPVLTCRDHRRRLMKALHVHDNHGGYGDG